MDFLSKKFQVSTEKRCQLICITKQAQSFVAEKNIKNGLLTVYCPHTTASITINENADPDVPRDIEYMLEKLIPNTENFLHSEGNSDAHIKSSLFGCSKSIPIIQNYLALGRWQGIFLCEFDGPRNRNVIFQLMF